MCVISLHYIGAYPMKEPKCKKRNLGVMSKIVSYITDFPRCISHLLKKKIHFRNMFPRTHQSKRGTQRLKIRNNYFETRYVHQRSIVISV